MSTTIKQAIQSFLLNCKVEGKSYGTIVPFFKESPTPRLQAWKSAAHFIEAVKHRVIGVDVAISSRARTPRTQRLLSEKVWH